ncbi:MAG: cysteine hydrolase [Dehalococcoidia bacterium]|nr:cysteine hydrolase [Dehalococcoidia bacterium]
MTDNLSSERKAIIVVDMQKDNVGGFCRAIIPNIKLLIQAAREKGIPIIFACDSRYPDDFIFTRAGHPQRTIRGTEGVKVIEELDPRPSDVTVEKRMLSGFFGSDLDFTLRQKSTETLIVTGVSTWACVLKTAYDAVELGYQVVVPADCCASPSPEDHEFALKLLERLGILTPTVKEVIETL